MTARTGQRLKKQTCKISPRLSEVPQTRTMTHLSAFSSISRTVTTAFAATGRSFAPFSERGSCRSNSTSLNFRFALVPCLPRPCIFPRTVISIPRSERMAFTSCVTPLVQLLPRACSRVSRALMCFGVAVGSGGRVILYKRAEPIQGASCKRQITSKNDRRAIVRRSNGVRSRARAVLVHKNALFSYTLQLLPLVQGF